MGNGAFPGCWAKREPDVWDLKQTRQKQTLTGLEHNGPQVAGSQGPVGWQEMRSFRSSRQESGGLEH